MKKYLAIVAISLFAASPVMSTAQGYADDDDRGGRQDLRQDRQQLEQLRERRNHEIREGDRHEAREYNDKIHDLQRDIHKDRRALHDHEHDRRDHDPDHDHD